MKITWSNVFLFLGILLMTIVGCKNRQVATVNLNDEGVALENKYESFTPGTIWPDGKGGHMNACGGGILMYKGKYYWFREHRTAGNVGNLAQLGMHCYSSTNLYNWKDEGVSLTVSNDKSNDIAKGCMLERPKVVYNKRHRSLRCGSI